MYLFNSIELQASPYVTDRIQVDWVIHQLAYNNIDSLGQFIYKFKYTNV